MTDTSRKPAKYVGAPATKMDWRDLYSKSTVTETLNLIERASLTLMPQRIIVLYVPYRDADALISSLDFVCFLAPLAVSDNEWLDSGNPIAWRHDKPVVRKVVHRTLAQALKETNALKAEITDKRISPLTLPARNFCYPDRSSTIKHTYQEFMKHTLSIEEMRTTLTPSRFTRDQLPGKAFKGQQHTDVFFQDKRGLIFPPDIYHAPVRTNQVAQSPSTLSLTLQQKYRFGVLVRDGNLHYDVQYRSPRKLRQEAMYCAMAGNVLVTGSHANVGVNDIVWVPGGTKEEIK